MKTNGLTRHAAPRPTWLALWMLLLPALLSFAPPTAVGAQEVAPAPSETSEAPEAGFPAVTVEQVEAERKRLDDTSGLDEALAQKLREKYQLALQALQKASDWKRQEAQFAKWSEEVQPAMQDVLDDLRQPQPRFDFEAARSQPLPELRAALAELEKRYQSATAELSALDEEPQRRAARSVEIPKQLAEAQQRQIDAEMKLRTPPPEDQPPSLAQADRFLWAAQRQAALAEQAAAKAEQASYAARKDLLPKRRELAAREQERLQRDVESLRALVAQKGKNEAREQAQDVWREIPQSARQDPYFQDLVGKLERLIRTRTSRAAELAGLTDKQAELEQASQEVQGQFDLTRNRMEGGTAASFGLVLRRERAELPSVRNLRREVAARDQAIRQAKADLYEWRNRRLELRDIDRALREQLSKMPRREGSDPRPALAALLTAERDLLDGLISDTEVYLNQLVRVNADAEDFADLVESYAAYIDERVYWVRSTDVLALKDFAQAVKTAGDFFSFEAWSELGGLLLRETRRRPQMYVLPVVALALLLYFQSRLRRRIAALGQTVSRSVYMDFTPTLRVLVLTFLIAAPWPALLLYLSDRFTRLWTESSGELLRGLASGLWFTAWALLSLLLAYQVCRHMGLAEAHFRWPAQVLRLLRKNLRVLVFFGMPLLFLVVTLQSLATLDPSRYDMAHNSLGRLSFMGLQVLILLALQRIIRPQGGALEHVIRESPGSWMARLHTVWYAAILAVPLLFAGLAASGFYDTALHLSVELHHTSFMVFALVLVGALLVRWVMVGRRRLAFRHALEARSQRRHAEGGEGAAPVSPDLDLSAINLQIQKLIRGSLVVAGAIGLWLIWRDVLPALGVLDQMDVAKLGAETSLSVADLLAILLLLAMTAIATRSGPSLIEFLLLQRLPLHSSVRYAISTLSQYAIAALGIVIVAHRAGIQWDLVVWLLAPLGVGLGFGLQEIFSNFVCGIVLLFEQPIRVGDVVTLGDTTGVVTRIRIRATTIRNWDQQELVIPNKDLITGRLINWTLTDTVNRIQINVGVAYGSDTERAREILFELLRENPHVLDNPEPLVNFEGFGDSTLNIVIRAYLPSMDKRLPAIHALHTRINQRFREEGIEIAFPQRDLHIRSIPDIWKRELPAAEARPAEARPAEARPAVPQLDLESGGGASAAGWAAGKN